MARPQTPTLTLGLLACFVGVVVVLRALLLGFYIEADPAAIADSAKGHKIAVPAVIAFVVGVVAVLGRRRRWGAPVAVVAAAAAVVAVVLTLVLPGAED